MNMEKLKELFRNEAFATALYEAADYEAAQKLFADNGVELTLEEVVEIGKSLASLGSDELDADDLDNVSGGVSIFKAILPLIPLLPIKPTPLRPWFKKK